MTYQSLRSAPQSDDRNGKRPSLLIVDDDYDTCDLIRAFLSQDFDCDMAYDGETAIDKISANDYAAIIADLMLPKMDGYEVLARASGLAPSTPIIIVTAMSCDVVKAMEMGAFDYIAKPFDPEQVEMSVRRAVNLHYHMPNIVDH
ncbi:MAG TPA: response regulator [Blastocatellia bacterium]|nr:response regulator [Blastocatellia bacterium]